MLHLRFLLSLFVLFVLLGAAFGCKPRSVPATVTIEGTLSEESPALPGDGTPYERYELAGKTGDKVTIELRSNDFDPYLLVADDENEFLAQNDDCQPGSGENYACVDYVFDQAQRVWILVNSYKNTSGGDFQLRYARTQP